MKYELTREQLEELAMCIAVNGLDADEACDYALAMAAECLIDEAEIVDSEI